MEPYSEGEIKRAIFQMCPTKAPGIDGFFAIFSQKYWDLVKGQVLKSCVSILNGEAIDPKLNETLLVLIPKVKNPTTMDDFRPISLCNVVMKIVTKTLANRLKDILPGLISERQSGFIKGRSISDNFLKAHEVIHSLKRRNKNKKGLIALKLDMSKAYDQIEWNFLERMLLAMGFDSKWVQIVMNYVSSVTYRVKINGSFSAQIQPHRGLRQGVVSPPISF